MSTRPAFLKGLFGTPNDDPLLQPSQSSKESFDTSVLEDPEVNAHHASPEGTQAPPPDQQSSEEDDTSPGPPSLYARIQMVMDRTKPPVGANEEGRSRNGRGSSSNDANGVEINSHYAPSSSCNAESRPTDVGGDSSPRTTRHMRIRSGRYEAADLEKINQAVNDGWRVETVHRVSENDTLVDVVLRRDRPPSLFDFDVSES